MRFQPGKGAGGLAGVQRCDICWRWRPARRRETSNNAALSAVFGRACTLTRCFCVVSQDLQRQRRARTVFCLGLASYQVIAPLFFFFFLRYFISHEKDPL